ncbi:MAG: HlyC/CorC family transporter [Bacteroidaceae bacterium]|jgi:CBS domain containing-hemolysin-like protein|nr:HlyC/CorC family transporter [Bacteroidaceae bacterium]
MDTTGIFLLTAMIFSAFFSGMEIAFVSSSKLRFEVDKNSQSLSAKLLSVFYNNPNNYISTMLVGNNIALVIYGIMMSRVIDGFLEQYVTSNPVWLLLTDTIISTLIILVVGEFIPKTIFKINPNATLRFFSLPTFLIYCILYPISLFATACARIILRLFGIKLNKENSTKAFTKMDLDYFIQSSIQQGNGAQDLDTEVKIFQNALDFSNLRIRDCMVHRTEIEAVSKEATSEELMRTFVETGFSKLIVYEDTIDNIIGYIHSSEMFKNASTWQEHICKMPFVPESMQAQRLMEQFLQQKKSLAVVVDEFGGTAGIISLEDIVEELFGEIEDEHDTDEYIAKKTEDDTYLLSARLEIERVNEMFGLNLPESDNYQTIAGFILNHYRSFPKMHEIIQIDNFRIKIIKVESSKIELITLKIEK